MKKVRIFLSWSGPASQKAAACLHRYIPKISPLLDTWMSSEDIRSGVYWSIDIRNSLRSARAGIICVTPDNVDSKWLLYESGALAHAVGKLMVVPYLVGFEPPLMQGPLTQFQCVVATKLGTEKLLRDLNELLLANKLSESHLLEVFDVWWPRISQCLIEAEKSEYRVESRPSERELLEEAVQHLRFLRHAEAMRSDAQWATDFELAKEIVSWDKKKVREFFEKILQPEALTRARREYEYISLSDEITTIRERADEIASRRAAELGVGDAWHAWRSGK